MRFRTITATMLAAVGLGLAGCEAGSGPTDPEEHHANTVLVNGVRLVRVAPVRGLTSAGGDSDARVVTDEEGGGLATVNGRIEIHPSSVREDVLVIMKDVDDGTVTIRFGPSGTTFDPTAHLSISAAGVDVDDKSRLVIAGASDLGDDWRIVGGEFDSSTDGVHVEIEHFSKYALALE